MATEPPMIVLGVGQTRRVALPGHGSGGFSWSVLVAGDDDSIRLGWRAGERPPLPPDGGLPPPSYSLDQILVIDALAIGRVVLDCTLSRGGAVPIERRRFTVAVVADLPPVLPVIPTDR